MLFLRPAVVRPPQAWRWPVGAAPHAGRREACEPPPCPPPRPPPCEPPPCPPPPCPPPPVHPPRDDDDGGGGAGPTAEAAWQAAAPAAACYPAPARWCGGPSFLKVTREAPQANLQVFDAVRFTRLAAARGPRLRFLPGEGCVLAAPGAAYLVTASAPCVYCEGTTLRFTANFVLTVDGEPAGGGLLTTTAFSTASAAHHVVPPRGQYCKIGLRVENVQRQPADHVVLSLGDVTRAGQERLFRANEQSLPWLFVQEL
jgi:hypothetical protein